MNNEQFVAPPGYKGYHGTDVENVPGILREGLRSRSEQDSTVCFTEDPGICLDFGNATIEADLSGLLVERFWDEGDGDGCWEVRTAGPVPPERLRWSNE